jgi:alkanesulfonate monooxygenase SsuD/methylene tetrahydromethanopterin reductase-like flavin-dependent oxidoreductase (luciferase family)
MSADRPPLEVGAGSFSMQSSYARPVRSRRAYRETKAEVELAEEVGFDSAWMGEHHFSYDGYCPSLLAAAGYLAAGTSTIRLCTGVMLLPLHSPGRVAAGVAALQSVAPNRVRLSFGFGYRDDELRSIGVDPSMRVKLFVRYLDELLSDAHAEAMAGTEIWLGGSTEKAIGRAARRGLSFVLPSHAGPTRVAMVRDEYNAALQPREGVGGGKIGVIKEVWVDDDEASLRDNRARLEAMWRHYSQFWVGPDDGDDKRDELVDAVSRKSIMGTSDQVASELAELVEAGADLISCRVRFDGQDHGRVRHCLELLGYEVIPQLRKL